MDTNACVRHMLDKAGMSPYAVSLAMGRAHSYMGQALKRKGGIGAPVLAEIAQACGYTLQLVGHGETLTLDGTRETEDKSED